MGASFLLRECKKDGGMNVEAQTEREGVVQEDRNTGLLMQRSLPCVCSCLHQWGWIVYMQPSYLR